MDSPIKYKAISVTVPSEMERALQELCRREIRKKSEVVTEALRLYFVLAGGNRNRGHWYCRLAMRSTP